MQVTLVQLHHTSDLFIYFDTEMDLASINNFLVFLNES